MMLVKFGIRNVQRNSRRSAVAVATVAIGVFGLLFLQGFFAGLLKTHEHNSIHSRHGHGQLTTKGYWDQPFEKPMEKWIKKPEAVVDFLQNSPLVQHFFPRVQFFALLSNGQTNVAGKGQGIVGSKEANFFNQLNFIEGGPIGSRPDGLALGSGLARALNVKVGDSLTVLGQTMHGTLNGFDVTVTGIFNVGFKEADDMLFQVQLGEAQELLGTSSLESIVIGLNDKNDWELLATEINARFPDLEPLSVYVVDKVWAENGRLFLTALMNIFRLIFLGIILLAIYSTASTTVLERKREIGVLRANGESARSVILLLVTEGAVIAFAGAILGFFLVFAAKFLFPTGITMPPTPGTSRALSIQLSLTGPLVVSSLFWGGFTATLACFFSTLHVLKIPLSKALKL